MEKKKTVKKSTGKKKLSKKKLRAKRRALRRRRIRIACFIVLVCVLALLAAFFMRNTMINGEIYPLSAQNIDLRGQGLSSLHGVSRMTKLNEALLSGNEFTDVSSLSALTECKYIDLTDNPVSSESYAQLRAALPDCLILCEAEDNTTTEMVLGGYPLPDMNAMVRVFASHSALRTVDLRGTDMSQQTGDALRVRFPHINFIYSADGTADTLMLNVDSSVDAVQALKRVSDAVHVTVTGCVFTPEEYRALKAQFPGMELDCLIDLYGNELPLGVEEIDLGESKADAAMEENLRLFSGLKKLTIGETMPSEAARIKSAFGLETLHYRYNGCLIAPETTEIDLREAEGLSADQMELLLGDLPQLRKVTMNVPDEQMLSVISRNKEQIQFIYDVQAFGQTFSTASTVIDLGDAVTDDNVQELVDLLKQMPALEEALMYESTLSQANMDMLFDGNPDVFFGWTIKMCRKKYVLRTDAEAFSTKIGAPMNYYTEKDLYQLRYCTRLQALDLGHNAIEKLDFLYNMPHLKLLILADNRLDDIGPIASLKELEYLELFMNYEIGDLSELSELPLRHLNLRYCGSKDNPLELDAIVNIKTLERFWSSKYYTEENGEQRLKAALPDCEVSITRNASTDNGWRETDVYPVVVRIFDTGKYEPIP